MLRCQLLYSSVLSRLVFFFFLYGALGRSGLPARFAVGVFALGKIFCFAAMRAIYYKYIAYMYIACKRGAGDRGPDRAGAPRPKAYLLGLLAKIKCSICSYQLNLWYAAHGVASD